MFSGSEPNQRPAKTKSEEHNIGSKSAPFLNHQNQNETDFICASNTSFIQNNS
jgi:hypothetical protein